MLTRRALIVSAVSAAGLGACRACADAPASGVICAFKGALPEFVHTKRVSPAPPEAQRAVALIVDGVGLRRNFEVLQGEFARKVGGFATIRGGRRYIVYDAEEFSFGAGRTDWVAMGLLGHEIGHHLASHVYLDGASSHADELEADRFAGVALARLGASLDQALAWTAALNREATESHPARARRQEEAEAGWRHGRAMVAREGGGCRPGWEGERFALEGRTCRIARVCEEGRARARPTCRDASGIWRWVDD